jgi:hypothetical protein
LFFLCCLSVSFAVTASSETVIGCKVVNSKLLAYTLNSALFLMERVEGKRDDKIIKV